MVLTSCTARVARRRHARAQAAMEMEFVFSSDRLVLAWCSKCAPHVSVATERASSSTLRIAAKPATARKL